MIFELDRERVPADITGVLDADELSSDRLIFANSVERAESPGGRGAARIERGIIPFYETPLLEHFSSQSGNLRD